MDEPSANERERRALELVDELHELDQEQREALLSERVEDDPALVARVRELYALVSDHTELTPPRGLPDLQRYALEEAESLLPGTRVGAFVLQGLLGEGGMGRVYEAEQDDPRRRVALKTMRSPQASPQVLQRFRVEAELYAHLRHPAIAQVHGAGVATIDGPRGSYELPYFALEFVTDARTLVRYATEEALPLRARLRLFLEIVRAIEHAHQRGVIHRDLKPANLLVDGEGRPKVIDFGVARVQHVELESTGAVTREGQVVGTPAYMAPEQVDLAPAELDVRIDVFALGAVLYELLCGRPPLETAGVPLGKLLREVAEARPPRPRRLRPDLPLDLEAIVRKAMARERDERYGTAAALGDDLERFLRDETVIARPPTVLHQLRLFSRRNRALVTALAAGLLSLVGATMISWYSARTARIAESAERAARRDAEDGWRAERAARERAAELFGRLVDSNLRFALDFTRGLARIPGSTEVRAQLLQRVGLELEQVLNELADDEPRRGAAAETLLDLADVRGNPKSMNLGDREGALALYDRVLELTSEPGWTDARRVAVVQARALTGIAGIAVWRGEEDRARALFEEAEELLDPYVGEVPDVAVELRLIAVLTGLATLAGRAGDDPEALRVYSRAEELTRRRHDRDPADPGARLALVRARGNVALALTENDREAEALAIIDDVLASLEGLRAARGGVIGSEILNWATIHIELLIRLARPTEAIAAAEEALSLCEDELRLDPGNTRLPNLRLHLVHNLGWAYQARAEAAIAEGGAPVDDLEAAHFALEEARSLYEELDRAGRLHATEQRSNRIQERLERISELTASLGAAR